MTLLEKDTISESVGLLLHHEAILDAASTRELIPPLDFNEVAAISGLIRQVAPANSEESFLRLHILEARKREQTPERLVALNSIYHELTYLRPADTTGKQPGK